MVCSADGIPLQDLLMVDANQEHGIIAQRPGSSTDAAPHLPIGSQVRILPNHACATAAQFPSYQTLDGAQQLAATWPRFYGW